MAGIAAASAATRDRGCAGRRLTVVRRGGFQDPKHSLEIAGKIVATLAEALGIDLPMLEQVKIHKGR
jgi:hypothetical protein